MLRFSYVPIMSLYFPTLVGWTPHFLERKMLDSPYGFSMPRRWTVSRSSKISGSAAMSTSVGFWPVSRWESRRRWHCCGRMCINMHTRRMAMATLGVFELSTESIVNGESRRIKSWDMRGDICQKWRVSPKRGGFTSIESIVTLAVSSCTHWSSKVN